MKYILLLALITTIGLNTTSAQKGKKTSDYWFTMEDVNLKPDFDPFNETFDNVPTFGKKIQRLDGKKIHLKGYIIPADLTKGRMTLSKFPYSSCFFCGGAPEWTVIEIEAKTPIIYRMDTPIILSGTLRLNKRDKGAGKEYDPFRLLYILEDTTYYTE